MPLSRPTARTLMHTREIRCQGYLRDDGLWDIEGRIVDTKAYSYANIDRGGIAAGEPLHDMTVRLTIDDDGLVHAAEATTDFSPFSYCPAITPDYTCLKGLKIGPGWRRAVHERIGGVRGCTHINDLLLGPVAVTAFQTLSKVRKAKDVERPRGKAPRNLNTCHALASTSPMAPRLWPDLFADGADGPNTEDDRSGTPPETNSRPAPPK